MEFLQIDASAQIGSARGYQELSAPFGISDHAEPAGAADFLPPLPVRLAARLALLRRVTHPADLRVSRPAAVGRSGRQAEWLPRMAPIWEKGTDKHSNSSANEPPYGIEP